MEFPEKWLQNDKLGERITNDIRLKVINRQIPIGTILTENQISSSYSTSRSPVRESFKTIANEGLVKLGRMGAEVLGLTKKDIGELYDLRFLLESFAFERIMKTFDKEQALTLSKTLQMMQLSAEHDDYMDFSYYDLLFHENVIVDANHKRILYTWNSIRHILLCLLIVATKKRFAEDKNQVNELIENHRDLIDVLLSKDKNRLEDLMQDHFIDTKKTVIDAYFS